MNEIIVKVCGITTPEAARAAAESGADMVGFVFADSPRRVEPERAAVLAGELPPSVRTVAVFHRASSSEIESVCARFRPDLVQVESPGRAPQGVGLLPVLHDGPDFDPAGTDVAGPVLLDGGARGGQGLAADRRRAAALARRARVLLAGGLSPENVASAVRAVRPWGVDASSGLESRSGLKDPARIRDFFAAARAAARDLDQLDALVRGAYPDARGRFGEFGGRFVPETLVPALERLEAEAPAALNDRSFRAHLDAESRDWIGRPTALTAARGLGAAWGAEIWLKREDLCHTGAHKVNNALGQALLARRLGARRVVAETGAGQHGVAAAAACARVGLPCTVYMGAHDIERQAPNVDRMRTLGATVVPVTTGDRTLRAAIDEAIRDWVSDPGGTYYLLGSAVGPHPYPWLVRELQAVIGREARTQAIERAGGLPDAVVACVGGGSNAIGLFHAFLADTDVDLVGIEAGGRGEAAGDHARTLGLGRPGVLHGALSYLLQDEDGQVRETHSISAGLDYPGVGPEHAFLRSIGRVRYESATDAEARSAFEECCAREGIVPALESAHALAGARALAATRPGSRILVGLSGRGDKDLPALAGWRTP